MDYPSPYFLEVENLIIPIRADGGLLYVNTGYIPDTLIDIDRKAVLTSLTQFELNLGDSWDLSSL